MRIIKNVETNLLWSNIWKKKPLKKGLKNIYWNVNILKKKFKTNQKMSFIKKCVRKKFGKKKIFIKKDIFKKIKKKFFNIFKQILKKIWRTFFEIKTFVT